MHGIQRNHISLNNYTTNSISKKVAGTKRNKSQ